MLHVWTSRVETIEEPDYIFFDLDPGEKCTIKTLATVALEVRDQLASIGLTTLVKTSGGMGLHVVVPLADGYTYDTAKMFAELVAHARSRTKTASASRSNDRLQSAIKRRSTSTIVQVGRGKTIVSAVLGAGARRRAGLDAAAWDEVEAFARKRSGAARRDLRRVQPATTPKRLERDGDLWAGKAWKKQRLEPAIAKAQKAWS